MIRVALYILLVGVIAFGAAWLADRPGDIVLDWQGWHLETSLMVAAVAIIVIVVALMVLWTLIRFILHGPSSVSGFFRERRQARGFRALSRGMVAAGAGDARLARHSAKEAHKLLRDEPLTLLLDAQAAQLAGDRKSARAAFETMTERPDTELLGLRGLLIEAQRAGDEETARLCVERAAERAPGLAWAATALLDQQTREGNWQAALATVERNAEHRLIDKKAAKRARAVLMTAQALELEDAEPDRALTLALEAHKLAPELVPAAVVAGRQSAAAGNTRQATRVIEKTWRLSPHPDLAEVYAHARSGDSARDRLKRAKALLQKMPNNEEGRIAVAVAAMEARDWSEAREAIEPLTRTAPSQRVCLLMADIAEGETGDAGRVREWLSRAVRAPRDPAWIADGYISEQWAPVSPISGHLDAFEWKVPVEAIAAPEAEAPDDQVAPEAPPPLIEAPAAESAVPASASESTSEAASPIEQPPADEPTEEPAIPPTPEAIVEVVPDPEPEPESEPVVAEAPAETSSDKPEDKTASEAGVSESIADSDTEAASPVTTEPDTAGSVDKSASSIPAAFERPPDDPGPLPEDEEDSKPKRRFGLF